MSHSIDDHLDIRPVSELTPRAISWLVPGRFAFGQVAIIDGDPDLGKSLLMLDLAARLRTGRSWPDGQSAGEAAGTIYLSAEDGDEDTIRPRLQALGADLGRIFVLFCKSASVQQHLRLPSGIGFLDRALASSGARLVVIDPIVAFLDPEILSGSDESIRRALIPLTRLARKHQCVIILIRHLNKKAGSRSLYRGGGSIGLIAQCRSGWLVGLEPREQKANLLAAADSPQGKRCVLAQLKNNNAPLQPSLRYEIIAHASGYPTIRWLGTCSVSAEDLVAKPAPITLGPRLRACQFLKDFLADGPRSTRDIWDAGFQQQLYERTLRRAKKDARITSRVAWVDGRRQCYWMLPGQEPPASKVPEQSAAPVQDIDHFFENFAKMYPPRTPLDDDEDFAHDPGPVPAERTRERASAERLPALGGERERASAERAHEIGRTLSSESGSAEMPELVSPSGASVLSNEQGETPTPGIPPDSADSPETPVDSSQTKNGKRDNPNSPVPPPNLPEHARWLWNLTLPCPGPE